METGCKGLVTDRPQRFIFNSVSTPPNTTIRARLAIGPGDTLQLSFWGLGVEGEKGRGLGHGYFRSLTEQCHPLPQVMRLKEQRVPWRPFASLSVSENWDTAACCQGQGHKATMRSPRNVHVCTGPLEEDFTAPICSWFSLIL